MHPDGTGAFNGPGREGSSRQAAAGEGGHRSEREGQAEGTLGGRAVTVPQGQSGHLTGRTALGAVIQRRPPTEPHLSPRPPVSTAPSHSSSCPRVTHTPVLSSWSPHHPYHPRTSPSRAPAPALPRGPQHLGGHSPERGDHHSSETQLPLLSNHQHPGQTASLLPVSSSLHGDHNAMEAGPSPRHSAADRTTAPSTWPPPTQPPGQ